MKISILFLLSLLGTWAFVAVGTVPPPKYRVTVDLTQDSLPPPSVEEVDTAHVYKIVEEMPLFKTCPDAETRGEKKKCSDEGLIKYIFKHMALPDTCAKELRIPGTFVGRFIINEQGNVERAVSLKKTVCEEYENHMIKILENMPAWESPGKQNGVPVKVELTIPVRINFRI